MLDLNRKIYVVDNDLALRSSLAIMLRSVGYDVELFDDGEAFLRAAQGGLSGCIVLDVRLRGFGGNDTLIIGDANFVRVDGGTGTDTLRLAGPTGFDLNLSTLAAGAIKDIEQIDLVAGSLNNTLTVTQQTLLDLSSTSDLLKVFGDSGDTVNATGFVTGGSQTENGITYNVYTNGSATLWVQDGVVVNTPAQSGFIAPTISWAEHAVLAA